MKTKTLAYSLIFATIATGALAQTNSTTTTSSRTSSTTDATVNGSAGAAGNGSQADVDASTNGTSMSGTARTDGLEDRAGNRATKYTKTTTTTKTKIKCTDARRDQGKC